MPELKSVDPRRRPGWFSRVFAAFSAHATRRRDAAKAGRAIPIVQLEPDD